MAVDESAEVGTVPLSRSGREPPSKRGRSGSHGASAAQSRGAMEELNADTTTNGRGSVMPQVSGAAVTQDTVYIVYAKAKNASRVDEALKGAPERLWMDVSPRVRGTYVPGDFFIKNPHALLDLRQVAELIVPMERVLEGYGTPGIVDLWPDRVREKGQWKAPEKWENYTPQMIFDDLAANNFKIQAVSVSEQFAKCSLRVVVSPEQFCPLMNHAKASCLQAKPITETQASVGVLRVEAATKVGACVIPKVYATRKRILAMYENVSWGERIHTKEGAFACHFYTTTKLTDELAWTEVKDGVRVSVAARMTGVNLSTTLQHVDNRGAEERDKYRSPTADEEQAKMHKEAFDKRLEDTMAATKDMMRAWNGLRLSEETACTAASIVLAEREEADGEGLAKLPETRGPKDIMNWRTAPRKRARGADVMPAHVNDLYNQLQKALSEEPPKVIPTFPKPATKGQRETSTRRKSGELVAMRLPSVPRHGSQRLQTRSTPIKGRGRSASVSTVRSHRSSSRRPRTFAQAARKVRA